MYGHTVPFVDPARTGDLLTFDDVSRLCHAQGEDWAPFVWYTVPGVFTSSELPAYCPASLVISCQTDGLVPEATQVGSLVAG
eukprot:7175161-Alexandrium_andersonii.AAC.1